MAKYSTLTKKPKSPRIEPIIANRNKKYRKKLSKMNSEKVKGQIN